MITAIVMIKCEVGKVHDVAEALVDLDAVAEVYSISGDHDILAILRVKEYDRGEQPAGALRKSGAK